MTDRIRLRQICHSRSGDKGDTVNIGIVVYDSTHYQWVKEHVTVEAVGMFLKNWASGPVERYELPNIGALNFVVHNALGGGVTRSLRIDGHGKGFSAILLEMEIKAPPHFQGLKPEQIQS
jgi:hypothetical protein